MRHIVINYCSYFVTQKREAGQYLASFLITWRGYKYFSRRSCELSINIFLYSRLNAITFTVISNLEPYLIFEMSISKLNYFKLSLNMTKYFHFHYFYTFCKIILKNFVCSKIKINIYSDFSIGIKKMLILIFLITTRGTRA